MSVITSMSSSEYSTNLLSTSTPVYIEQNMSTTAISSLQLAASNLTYVAMMFLRCYCFVVIPLGVIGHLMSIYVFTRRTMSNNPCGMYFLAATIVGLINTCYTLPMRMLQSGFIDSDPGAYSTMFCKLTWLSLYSIRGICPWLVVLACCDRYLSSCASVGIRVWSSLHVAQRVIPVAIILGILLHIHVPIMFKIDIIPATQKPVCYPPGPPGTYRVVFSFFNLFYVGLLPSFCMLLFGLLAFKNIERSKRLLVAPSRNLVTKSIEKNLKVNRHMFRMLFLQVSVYCTTGLTYSISAIYTAVNASQPKNVFQVSQENMITVVVGIVSNTGPCLSFYLFTLSSSLFRKELKKLFRRSKPITRPLRENTTQTAAIDRPHRTTRV